VAVCRVQEGFVETLNDLKDRFLGDIASCSTAEQAEELKIRYLGRKGFLAEFRKGVDFKTLDPEARSSFGRDFNDLKTLMETELGTLQTRFTTASSGVKLPKIDMTRPGTGRALGTLHPISLVQMELENIFMSMGFHIEYGYEVETEYYNFEALNIPADHPAREMQDTFWLTNGMLLRTHTSANQVHALEKYGAPLKAIFPGRCFRYENIDATHENTFYQIEGLMVDRHITVSNLISVMRILLSEIFHRDVKTRLRPGFFPFVEPGFELDINCLICGGVGCKSCKNSGWLELLPCGIVHPNVLRYGGIDPEQWSGFAFGLGLTRRAMLKYGIPDIRTFNSGDIRALDQFTAAV